MPDQTLNLNNNYAECIKSVSHFGDTLYVNICNGTSQTVAWGGVDWALVYFLLSLGVLVILGGLAIVGFMLLSLLDW